MAIMSEMDAALKALLEYSEGIQETVRGIRALMSGGDDLFLRRAAACDPPLEEEELEHICGHTVRNSIRIVF